MTLVSRQGHNRHSDPCGGIDRVTGDPVLHYSRDSRVLDTNEHGTGEEVGPTHCKSHGRVDIASCEFEDGAFGGHISQHLSNTQIARPDEEDTPEAIGEEE